MVNQNHVLQKLISLLREKSHLPTEINGNSRLQLDLALDSVKLLEFILETENAFQIFLGEDPQNPPQTLIELADLILLRLQEAGRDS